MHVIEHEGLVGTLANLYHVDKESSTGWNVFRKACEYFKKKANKFITHVKTRFTCVSTTFSNAWLVNIVEACV
jgi:hypothetical protein